MAFVQINAEYTYGIQRVRFPAKYAKPTPNARMAFGVFGVDSPNRCLFSLIVRQNALGRMRAWHSA
ncbi:hypothetical protein J4G08_02570 [Candidatus Poribacteria bacterium]|nr:hypothetical protein [Candidatus Poribacteria bacterium]